MQKTRLDDIRVEFFHAHLAPTNCFVFLHGITGNNTATWTHNNGYSLLAYVRDTFTMSNILSIGYPSSLVSEEQFDDELTEIAVWVKDKVLGMLPRGLPIHFICHSQGGILVQLILTHVELARLTDARFSTIIDRVASISFFDTPHSGSRVASLVTSASRIIGLSNLPSRQLRGLAARNMSLAQLNASFLRFVEDRQCPILNVIAKPTIFGITVAESELRHQNVRNVRVRKGHSQICRPQTSEDEICTILEAHIATSTNRHINRLGSNRTCIIHFLDHHFLAMKGISNKEAEIGAETYNEVLRTFRMALMAFDKIIVPIASLVESEVAARIFANHRSDLLNVFSSENHRNVQDYITDSKRRIGTRYIFIPNRFEAFGMNEAIPIHLRSRSATPDILDGIRNIDIDQLLFHLKNIATDEWTLSAIRENWHNFEDSPDAEFVIPPIFERFVLDGKSDPAFFRAASQVINEYYFNSFLIDFDGWAVNPSGSCYHEFKFVDPRRVISIKDIVMKTSWRVRIPQMNELTLAEVEKLYYAEERKEFCNEFWKEVQDSLFQ